MSKITEQLQIEFELEMLRKLVEEARPHMLRMGNWDWVALANGILAPREPVEFTRLP
jgi:hypothetical protein